MRHNLMNNNHVFFYSFFFILFVLRRVFYIFILQYSSCILISSSTPHSQTHSYTNANVKLSLCTMSGSKVETEKDHLIMNRSYEVYISLSVYTYTREGDCIYSIIFYIKFEFDVCCQWKCKHMYDISLRY